MRDTIVLLIVLMTATVSVTVATVRHVPDEYPTIQAGIIAAVDGDTVLVADGIYTGSGNRDISFYGKGIVVMSEHGPQQTVIDCEGSSRHPSRGFLFQNEEDSTSVLRGFTIMNGYASDVGGAIFCDWGCYPSIVENIIVGNTAPEGGGGIYCSGNLSPYIEGNTMRGNTAYQGGGIDCYATFPFAERTPVGSGGEAVSRDPYGARITENVIVQNTTDYWGGGISCDGVVFTAPTIKENVILGNTADYGGGISCEDAWPAIEGNTISGNTAAYDGGGVFCRNNSYPAVVRNIIAGNMAGNGGGIYCDISSWPMVERSTIQENRATSNGGGIYCYTNSFPTVLNSILWGDSATVGQEIYSDGSITVNYSDIEGGWEGTGNIDADPLFVLWDKQDYRLLWGSPCIDIGHPDSLDPDGTTRDMGMFYFDQSTPLTIYLTPDTTVIARPGELGVTYTVINIDPDPWTFDLRSDVFLPNGKPYPGNPIVGPMEITLPGEKNVQRHLSHPVPGKAPKGTYRYRCRIGLLSDQLYDEDSFRFEVAE
jgi:predicted outer membrane repeat protein